MEPREDKFSSTQTLVRDESSYLQRRELRNRFRRQETIRAENEDATADGVRDLKRSQPVEEKGDTPDERSMLLDKAHEEEEKPIVRMLEATQMIMDSVFPPEKEIQRLYEPLLHFPNKYPRISMFCNSCRRLTKLCCCNFNDFATSSEENIHEIDIIDGLHLPSVEHHSTQESEFEAYLSRLMKLSQLSAKNAKEEGLYINDKPYLADLLLRGEELSLSLSLTASTENHILLSRATQRSLRELKFSIDREKLRQTWMSMISSDASTEGSRIISPLGLLTRHPLGPTTKVIDNVVDDRSLQPVLPQPNLSFGGVLGNWNENTSAEARLGNYVPKGLRNVDKRSIIRVNLYQLNILDHPLMIPEERARLELERIFIQYRAILQERVFSYLIFRIDELTNELQRSTQQLSSKAQFTDKIEEAFGQEISVLRALMKDFEASVCALVEVFNSFTVLTKALYAQWKHIRHIRQHQGFISTKIRLVGQRVQLSKDKDDQLSTNASKGKPLSTDEEHYALPRNLDIEKWKQLQAKLPFINQLFDETRKFLDQLSTDETKQSSELLDPSQTNKDDTVTIFQAITTLRSYSSLFPDFVFHLREDVDVTVDSQVPAEESQRRRSWQYYTWVLSVNIDNHLITSSTPCKVQPFPYHLPLQQSFEIRVAAAPKSIVINIFSALSTNLINVTTSTPLASIEIPAASMNEARVVTHVSTPIIGWFTTTSEKLQYRPTAGIFDWLFSPQDPSTASYFMAALLCSVEYDVAAVTRKNFNGVRPCETAVIPDRSIVDASDDHSNLSLNGFFKERDFQSLLPDAFYLDPNDPKNDSLLYTKLQGQQRLLDRDVFLLGKSMDTIIPYTENGLFYDNYAKMKMSTRLQLLSIRNRKPFLFTEPIPLAEETIIASEGLNEILSREAPPPDLMALMPMTATIRSSVSIEPPGESLPDDADMSTKNKVNEFIKRVRSSQVVSDRKLNRKAITTSSVVAERDYLQFRPQAENYTDGLLPARKRSLKPTPRPRIPMAQQVKYCNVLVQVVGARNIPLRVDVDDEKTGISPRGSNLHPNRRGSALTSSSSIPALRRINNQPSSPRASIPGDQIKQLTDDVSPLLDDTMFDETKLREKKRARTFVEVTFQDQTFATTACEGATPIWKQLITLPFHPPEDNFSPDNLVQVQDEVIFTLFDEVYEDDADLTGFLEGESSERIDKRFLGRFAVPFTTIYKTGRLEGLFRLNTPCFNIGYNHVRSKASEESMQRENPNELLINAAYKSSIWTSLFSCDCFGITSAPPLPSNPTNDLSSTVNHGYISSDIESELSYFSASDSSASFIKVLVTLDPFLVSPPSSTTLDRYEVLTSTTIPQDRVHVPYARRWINSLKEYSTSLLTRSFKIMATNSAGQDVLLCRYLTPQRPPAGFHTRRSCIHLVSMIPFLADSLSFSSDVDIWCTAKQTWEIGAGDEEEHAVLLYNYLYYLTHYASQRENWPESKVAAATATTTVRSSSINDHGGATVIAFPSEEQLARESVFLVQGNGIPEGETVYVMVRIHQQLAAPQLYESKNYLIINPSSGHCYSAADSSCPLKAIHILATPYNIWANIQISDNPKHILYDLQNQKAWRPFFNPQSYPYPAFGLHTIQEDVIYEIGRNHAIEIESSVREAIRVSFRRWRSKRLRSATTFHPDACAVVTETLARLEEWKRYGIQYDNSGNSVRPNEEEQGTAETERVDVLRMFEQEIKGKLRTVLRSRVLHGFPINIPYTDVDSILAEIKSYCIHEIKHPEVQFVLGVRAIPIVNNIISLWIYIGTLETTTTSVAQLRYPLQR